MQNAARQMLLFPECVEPDDGLAGLAIRESGRARRLSIKVFPRGRVEVVVPRRTRARDVQAFVDEHRDWIRQTRAAFARAHPPEPFRLPVRIELPAIGRVVGVTYEPQDAARTVRTRRRGDLVRLSGRTGDSALCVQALRRWLAVVARESLAPQLDALSAHTGLPYARLRVAGQRTCWGSLSGTGTLSVNYCLLFLKPALVRYLLVHELCHARHMNHSRRFWSLVREFEPDYKRLDRALSESWKAIPSWVGIY